MQAMTRFQEPKAETSGTMRLHSTTAYRILRKCRTKSSFYFAFFRFLIILITPETSVYENSTKLASKSCGLTRMAASPSTSRLELPVLGTLRFGTSSRGASRLALRLLSRRLSSGASDEPRVPSPSSREERWRPLSPSRVRCRIESRSCSFSLSCRWQTIIVSLGGVGSQSD